MSGLRAALARLLVIASMAGAIAPIATAAAPDDFQAPTGFNGHDWGSSLASLGQGAALWDVSGVAGSRGKASTTRVECKPAPFTTDCGAADMYSTQHYFGSGSHVMAEYYLSQDRNPWAQDRIQLRTISYLFCHDTRSERLPDDVRTKLKLCGTRIRFLSDPAAELTGKPEEYRSNYQRILRRLVTDFGMPPGFEQDAYVIVDGLEGEAPPPAPPRPSAHYRWCGFDLDLERLYPECPATVSLAFDRERGEGTLLFAAHPLYAWAWAMRDNGDPDNEIFRLLDDRPLDLSARNTKKLCTGTLICNDAKSKMQAKDRRAFEP